MKYLIFVFTLSFFGIFGISTKFENYQNETIQTTQEDTHPDTVPMQYINFDETPIYIEVSKIEKR